jgi:dTDP-glucose 4,6-dehydratase
MRCAVTGGAGFIGSNLVRMMLDHGHHVFNLDALTYAGNLHSLNDVASHPHYRFEQIDLVQSPKLFELLKDFQPDCVVHLAAESHVDRSIDGPGQFVQTNVVGTYQLLQASTQYWRSLPRASQDTFRFLHVSTDEVFGSLGNEGFFTESTAYDPRSPYSASKAASDHLVRAWFHTYGLPTLVTNCSNNYGPYQFPEKFIPVVLLKCLRQEPIPVYGKGDNIRDWLYVHDHCTALEIVLQRGRVGETYAIGGNNEMRNIDLATKLCRIMDHLHPPTTVKRHEDLLTFVTDRPGHDLRYAIDATKLREELGWQPNTDHDKLLRQTAQWYLENPKWWTDILSGSYRLDRLGLP